MVERRNLYDFQVSCMADNNILYTNVKVSTCLYVSPKRSHERWHYLNESLVAMLILQSCLRLQQLTHRNVATQHICTSINSCFISYFHSACIYILWR